jgi:hypothetical protein
MKTRIRLGTSVEHAGWIVVEVYVIVEEPAKQ